MTSSPPRQPTAYEQARLALADPNATAEQLLNGALGLEGAFIRNEHLIGLLPGDAPELMQAAYRAADAKGSRKAGLIWVRRAYFERAEPVAAAAARIDELTADDPDGEAHLVRGWMRQQGYGFDQDLVASAADLQVAAGLGNLDAVFELYIMAATGQGVAQDADQAQAYLEQAAQGGHRRALYNLAANYATGRGVAKDSARALQLYIQAAEKGNAQAAWTAALMLLTGEAGVVDLEAAGVLLVEAEELGMDVEAGIDQIGAGLGKTALEAYEGQR